MSSRRFVRALPAFLSAMLAGASLAQDAAPPEPVAPNEAAPVEATPAEPASEAKSLQALIMEIEGTVTTRSGEDAPWQPAKVDDLLNPGAELRTGFRSRAAIRVGMNATLLVDPGTTLVIPEIVEDGQTYRTRVAVKQGRADFKVDKLGLDNDFQVQMGSTTMAVKGTGGTISFGGFSGSQFSGANFNEIGAIEVRYFSNLQRVAISGAGRSSEANPNPVLAALASTVGPPPSGATAETGIDESTGDLANFPGTEVTQQISIITGAQQPGVAGLAGLGIGGPGGTPGVPGGGNGAGGGSAGGGAANSGPRAGPGVLGNGNVIGGGGGLGRNRP